MVCISTTTWYHAMLLDVMKVTRQLLLRIRSYGSNYNVIMYSVGQRELGDVHWEGKQQPPLLVLWGHTLLWERGSGECCSQFWAFAHGTSEN